VKENEESFIQFECFDMTAKKILVGEILLQRPLKDNVKVDAEVGGKSSRRM